MNRALWLLAEVFAGVMLAGALTAAALPIVMRAGRDPGPVAGGLMLVVSVGLCILMGERLRRRRRTDAERP